jgi:hypothetical protein
MYTTEAGIPPPPHPATSPKTLPKPPNFPRKKSTIAFGGIELRNALLQAQVTERKRDEKIRKIIDHSE